MIEILMWINGFLLWFLLIQIYFNYKHRKKEKELYNTEMTNGLKNDLSQMFENSLFSLLEIKNVEKDIQEAIKGFLKNSKDKERDLFLLTCIYNKD